MTHSTHFLYGYMASEMTSKVVGFLIFKDLYLLTNLYFFFFQQAFVRLTNLQTKQEIIFVTEPDESRTYKFDLVSV